MISVPIQDTQEKLGGAYIKAVVARAGCTLTDHGRGEYGHDYTITPVITRDGHIRDASWSINVQSKSTTTATQYNDHIAYELDIVNYNDLIDPNTFMPLILVVYVMPRDQSEWLSQCEDCMEIRHCAYWISLKGMSLSDNKRSVTVHLPKNQIFTPDAVRFMLDKLERGEQL